MCYPRYNVTIFAADTELKLPPAILYPTDFFPQSDKQQQLLTDDFVTMLETYLDVKKIEFSISKRWDANPPHEAGGKSLADYTRKVNSPFSPFSTYTHYILDRIQSFLL